MTISVSCFQSVSYIIFQYKKSWAHILVTQQNTNLLAVPENLFLWELRLNPQPDHFETNKYTEL